jgi:hypothetical protein
MKNCVAAAGRPTIYSIIGKLQTMIKGFRRLVKKKTVKKAGVGGGGSGVFGVKMG